MIYLKMFLYTIAIAFAIAHLEIQIEGKHGWAAKLPTWRLKNWLTSFFGQSHITGYHTWLSISIALISHTGFVLGLPWTVQTEFMLIGFFLIGAVIEDYLWFVLNPHYGWDKFSAFHISWHKWLLWNKVPLMYLTCISIAFSLIGLSFLLKI